jgi:hypothetical protein
MDCSENNCELEAKTKGLCLKHYQKLKRQGIGKGPCTIEHCKNNAYSKGMCKSHYEYNLKKIVQKDTTRDPCIVPNCPNRWVMKKMCTNHFKSFDEYTLKKRYFEYLGQHKCVLCGVDDIRLLQFDHIKDDGNTMRDSGLQLTNAKFKNDPELFKQTFQVLCANCNTAKRYESGGDLKDTTKTWIFYDTLIEENN